MGLLVYWTIKIRWLVSAGFSVDAAKHMWPDDLAALYEDMTLPDGRQPFIYHDVRTKIPTNNFIFNHKNTVR